MKKHDQFIHDTLKSELREGETIQLTAALFSKSLALMVLFGPLFALGSGWFYAAATDRRLFLIHARLGFFGLKLNAFGRTTLAYSEVRNIGTGGVFNQKTLAIHTADGRLHKFRLNTFARILSGQQRFTRELPALVSRWRDSHEPPARPLSADPLSLSSTLIR